MKDFCDCENSKGGLFLAAFIAVAELITYWWNKNDTTELIDELNHFKDESRHLRSELDKIREKYLTTESELHQVNLAFENYVYKTGGAEEEEAEG